MSTLKTLSKIFLSTGIIIFISFTHVAAEDSWIRVNLLGYKPESMKVAVWVGKNRTDISSFILVDVMSEKKVFESDCSASFGEYGPFTETYRLDFSAFHTPGRYYLKAGNTISPVFSIDQNVYSGSADFCLRYMRQQRCGYNPFLKDSCHIHDGYTMYGPMQDSTHIDVVGGWHDASDYLQYVTTSANATYHLMAAWRDFPNVFADRFLSDGHTGNNGWPDVLDEARWGLDWLIKMHPKDDWMFNQIADDRDHISMRMPKNDSQYGKGFERPVYFCSGRPQGLLKYTNNSNGLASTAGKFSSAFALGNKIFKSNDPAYALKLESKSSSAFKLGIKYPGVCQTAPCRAPYYYEEENWTDDMQLAATAIHESGQNEDIQKLLSKNLLAYAYDQALKEPITPWIITDTARHYQWYPFVNVGHYELAKLIKGNKREKIIDFYRQGIEMVQKRAAMNAFNRGIPFIWCSNNLTTSFAIQCIWYKELTGDQSYAKLEQANFDWLFGCNPWGTSFVYGLPSAADTPVDPHSAFTHIGKYPVDGGLVDGPVYAGIFNNLIGITLYEPDEYEDFQSQLAVYHDDYGDYSTNEPTMDGVASLIYLMAAKESEASTSFEKKVVTDRGAIIRGDVSQKKLAIVFTGDEFGDGGDTISKILENNRIKASFFLTGRYYRNPDYKDHITVLKKNGHYLGCHSDQHLLYCDWKNRDSLLITKNEFFDDLTKNYEALNEFGIKKQDVYYFLPPYEWYNDTISTWTKEYGLQLINYTSGTRSTADYTYPEMKSYCKSDEIYESIITYEKTNPAGLNGFILLVHIGTDPRRKDKFYLLLPNLLAELIDKGYQFFTIDELLKE